MDGIWFYLQIDLGTVLLSLAGNWNDHKEYF